MSNNTSRKLEKQFTVEQVQLILSGNKNISIGDMFDIVSNLERMSMSASIQSFRNIANVICMKDGSTRIKLIKKVSVYRDKLIQKNDLGYIDFQLVLNIIDLADEINKSVIFNNKKNYMPVFKLITKESGVSYGTIIKMLERPASVRLETLDKILRALKKEINRNTEFSKSVLLKELLSLIIKIDVYRDKFQEISTRHTEDILKYDLEYFTVNSRELIYSHTIKSDTINIETISKENNPNNMKVIGNSRLGYYLIYPNNVYLYYMTFEHVKEGLNV